MRRFFATLAVIALLPAAPAMAQSIQNTHAEHAGTSGKSPIKAYRQLARDTDCRTATNHHQTGKIPLTPQVATSASCQTELASRETTERKD